MPIVEVEW